MKNISRRNFLKMSIYTGAAASLPATIGRAASYIPTFRTYKPAAVIGSGFGGAVATLRLAKAGIPTALVERGQYWAYRGEESFPTTAAMEGDGRTTWLSETDATSLQPVPRYTGMLERISGDTTDAVCAAGLGGGSLVYGGVLLQPKQEVFEEVFPQIAYEEMDRIYYPRVLSQVSGGPIPDDILDSPNYAAQKAFIANATAAGLDVTRSHVGFDWDIIRNEIEGKVAPAASIGEYVFSCNSNAKNTLDKNYLASALWTGNLRIFTLHNVTTITQTRAGRYQIHCDVLNKDGDVVRRHVIVCDHLFMAAGSLNTTGLLLKARASGDLPGVNEAVGKSWGNNGDFLIGRIGVTSPIGTVQGGPPSIAAHDAANPIKPVSFMHSPSNQQAPAPLQLHMSMSVPEELGEISYDETAGQTVVHWPMEANAPSREAYRATMQKIADISGGNILDESAFGGVSAVWHPVGGAIMGEACSDFGELHGQPNLYVVDGSLLPGSAAAANPALTIAANAERIMEKLIPQLI